MKKVLIISESLLGEVLKNLLKQHYKYVCLSDYDNGLEHLLIDEPDIVLICEHWINDGSKITSVSQEASEDVCNSADDDVSVITIGFGNEGFGELECDVKLPVNLETLIKMINN